MESGLTYIVLDKLEAGKIVDSIYNAGRRLAEKEQTKDE